MKITKIFALYDKYNEMYFDNKLEPVDIAIVTLYHAFGYCIQEGNSISVILIDKNLKNSMVRTTLLHEMIHVYQVHLGHKMDHGRQFQQIAKRICKAENIYLRTF